MLEISCSMVQCVHSVHRHRHLYLAVFTILLLFYEEYYFRLSLLSVTVT